MTQLFTNNAASALAATITATDTSITLALNDGALFPALTGGDDFLVTLFQRVGTTEQNHEIVRCTARNGDVLTVVRGQEGTTARAFGIGDLAELRLTAGAILPVRAGALTGPLNEAPTVTIASAATVAIGTAKANTATISGTTTITGFDTVPAGITRRTVFSAALTLTHNVSKLILIGSANITVAAGDTAEWLSQGGGVWRMTNYTRINGDAVGVVSLAKGGTGATTAAAARTALGIGNVENKSANTINSEMTSLHVTSALGFTPVPSDYLAQRATVDPNAIPAQGGVVTNYLAPAASNRPPGTAHALLTLANSSTQSAQVAADYSANEFYIRTENADVFSSWRKLLHNADIIPLDKGGTGATTAAGALAAIGGVNNADITNRLAEYGIGTTNAAPAIADLDDATVRSGLYYTGPSTPGTFPTTPQGGFLLHKVYGTAGFQMFQPYQSNDLYFRRRSSSTWTAWNKLRNEASVVDIAQGGTGATTAAAARTALGLGSVENKSASTINAEMTSAQVKTSLGYTPVQMGTGTNQLGNAVKIGWLPGTKLGLTVDSTDFASIWPISITGNAATATNATNATTAATANAVAWANVSSKPSDIVSSWNTSIVAQDWNTITTAGTYNVANATGANKPAGYAFGQLVVTVNGTVVTQVYYPHSGDAVYRAKYNASDWNPWRFTVTSSNGTFTAADSYMLQGMTATSGHANGPPNSILSRDGNGDTAARVFWSATFTLNPNDGFAINGYSVVNHGLSLRGDRAHLSGYSGTSLYCATVERLAAHTSGVNVYGNFYSTGDVTAFSDETLKTNWRTVAEGFVAKWARVKCGIYDRTDSGATQAGLSAQSARSVLPEVVFAMPGDPQGRLGLSYGPAAAVATVELAKKAVDHEGQISELTALVNSLVERIKELEAK